MHCVSSAGYREAYKALSGGEWILVKGQGDRHLYLGSWNKSYPLFYLFSIYFVILQPNVIAIKLLGLRISFCSCHMTFSAMVRWPAHEALRSVGIWLLLLLNQTFFQHQVNQIPETQSLCSSSVHYRWGKYRMLWLSQHRVKSSSEAPVTRKFSRHFPAWATDVVMLWVPPRPFVPALENADWKINSSGPRLTCLNSTSADSRCEGLLCESDQETISKSLIGLQELIVELFCLWTLCHSYWVYRIKPRWVFAIQWLSYFSYYVNIQLPSTPYLNPEHFSQCSLPVSTFVISRL